MAAALRKQLRLTLQYNIWANRQVIAAVNSLPSEAYRKHTGLCFRSIQGTFNHIVLSSRVWYYRMTDQSDKIDFAHCWQSDYATADDDTNAWEQQIETKEEMIKQLAIEDARWLELLDTLSDDELVGEFTYTRTEGEPKSAVRSVIMAHITNHATHHRGQITAAITALGGKPPLVDLPYFDPETL
eukprot:TRINITY_DN12265_c0_g3_i10.p3 TRINITY_DN12265_c0_g3~~TRINITY_DN12265_c0_g3_i10.p3  ORF type:complete len:185 (+),score=31.67 TRINITY_DN12265_c0_g3_i10:3452-4006(+)